MLHFQLTGNAKPLWAPSHFGTKWATLARPFRYPRLDSLLKGASAFSFLLPLTFFLSEPVQSLLEMMLLGLIWVQQTRVFQ